MLPARLSSTPLPPLDVSVPSWPGRQVRVGAAELFVRATPSGGQPALVVHGLGGASTNWTDFAAQLAPWLAIEAPDLPGFGRSGPAPGRDYSIAAHTRTVIRYLDQSARGRVHLFGNSMGGVISILIAAHRPDLVRTLTLTSPAVPDLRPQRLRTDPLLTLALVPGTGGMIRRRIVRYPADVRARAVIAMCFADPSRVPPNRLAEAVEEIELRDGYSWSTDALLRSLRGLVRSYLVTGRRSLWARMAAITAPTLIVWGGRDRLVDVALAPRVARTIPGARLLVLPDVGHVPQLEDPVATASAALALLEDVGRVDRPAGEGVAP
ncbi:MAG TPA: alpha/beta fold hydrolase [Jatrophihabitantaceae bacterium]|jgi:pimeloyl-ACP methyl ester carboxylesterase